MTLFSAVVRRLLPAGPEASISRLPDLLTAKFDERVSRGTLHEEVPRNFATPLQLPIST